MDDLYQAQRFLDIADHLLTKTLPVVSTPKLLVSVIENIHLSHVHILRHVLDSSEDFPFLFQKFSSLSRFFSFHSLVFQVMRLLDEHRDSSVEFSRNEKFIICLENYDFEELGVENVKGYLFKSRQLLNLVLT